MEPEKANAWLNMLCESEKAFEEYNYACDNIEKLYANLEILRNLTRDRQFNLFWANLEILKPSIYAKGPRSRRRPQVQGQATALPDHQRTA